MSPPPSCPCSVSPPSLFIVISTSHRSYSPSPSHLLAPSLRSITPCTSRPSHRDPTTRRVRWDGSLPLPPDAETCCRRGMTLLRENDVQGSIFWFSIGYGQEAEQILTSIAERVFRCIAIVFICQLHWILGDQLSVLNEQYIVKPGVFSSSERNNASVVNGM